MKKKIEIAETHDEPPTIVVKQRVLTKRTMFLCRFFYGFAEVEYEDEATAKKTYEEMKKNKQKVKLKDNIVTEFRANKSSWEIFDLYLQDIKKAQTKNGAMMSIKYDLIN